MIWEGNRYKPPEVFEKVRRDETAFQKKNRSKRGYKYDMSSFMEGEKSEKGIFNGKAYQTKLNESCPFFVYTHSLHGKPLPILPHSPQKNSQGF